MAQFTKILLPYVVLASSQSYMLNLVQNQAHTIKGMIFFEM